MPPAYNPTGFRAGYVTPTKPKKKPGTMTTVNPRNIAGGGYGAYQPWTPNNTGLTTPGGPSWGSANGSGFIADFPDMPQHDPNAGLFGPGSNTSGRGPIWVDNRNPNYKGIIDRMTADRRARLNASLADMNIRRIGNARAAVNRLGVRDPNAMFAKLGQYGLTLEDLQAAAANPFSDIKAIDRRAEVGRGQGLAGMSGRGTFRSGGSAQLVDEVENQRAREDAQYNEEMLQGLAEQQFQQRDYERQGLSDIDEWAAQQEAAYAQAYQPQQAEWDDRYGGYRWGNIVYDENHNIIRTL